MATYALLHGAYHSGWHFHLLARELEARGHQVIAPELPARHPRIARLVYLGALLPEPGLSLDQQLQRDPSIFSHYQAQTEGIGHPDGSASCPEARALEVFFEDCPPSLAREAAAHLRRQHWRMSQEATPLHAWPTTPASYILSRDDRTVNPAWSRRVVPERLGVAPIEIAGGHSPFLARPAELAALLTAAD